jgi:hypothetical protein
MRTDQTARSTSSRSRMSEIATGTAILCGVSGLVGVVAGSGPILGVATGLGVAATALNFTHVQGRQVCSEPAVARGRKASE